MDDLTLTPLTGHDLKGWGHQPGPQFPELLARANQMLASGAEVSRIRDQLHVELSQRRFFEIPTIAELAEEIEQMQAETAGSINPK